MIPVALVCWGLCPSGTSYRYASFDEEGEQVGPASFSMSKRRTERHARALGRALSVPVRQSGKGPEVWVKAIRRWVPC